MAIQASRVPPRVLTGMTLTTEPPACARIEHADAREWLTRFSDASARVIVFDPPYAVGSPVRGREDGAAGSVAGPLSFMHRLLSLSARKLQPGGVVIVFCDYKRMYDLAYAATTAGLREAGCLAWVRNRPGTGGLFRASWDPVLLFSRGVPDAVDRAAVRNVVETYDVVRANYPAPRRHPYGKPPEVIGHVLSRVCRPGDLVLDPFAGSGASRTAAQQLDIDLVWRGCDIDPVFAEEAVPPVAPRA